MHGRPSFTQVLENVSKVYSENRDPKKILLVTITSNRGLCGGFNANIIKKAKYLKNCDTLVLAGGCFLNSIVNQKIIDSKIFNNIYIIPATDDSGISIGCAFNGYRKIQ